jgi:hypothetical protein
MLCSDSVRRVLYWPGIHRLESELAIFRQGLGRSGYTVQIADVPYDQGLPPDNPLGPVARWLARCVRSDWWIGLSFGAGVAHIAASIVPPDFRPQRVTLINPVADRNTLLKSRGLPTSNVWKLQPVEFAVSGVRMLEIVLSQHNMKVPRKQGLSLLDCYPGAIARTLDIQADHAISDHARQTLLLNFLLTEEMAGGDTNQRSIVVSNQPTHPNLH